MAGTNDQKQRSISRKISKLREEGYPQKQAVAMAHDYWERGRIGGQSNPNRGNSRKTKGGRATRSGGGKRKKSTRHR